MAKETTQGVLETAQLRDEGIFLDRPMQSGWVTTLSGTWACTPAFKKNGAGDAMTDALQISLPWPRKLLKDSAEEY